MYRGGASDSGFGIRKRARLGAAVATALALMASLLNAAFVAPAAGAAPGVPPVTYTTGDIDGQNGWAGTAGGNINDSIDQAVVANGGAPASFEDQSWRISNAFTTNSFADQTFSPSVADEAGETSAESGGLAGGTRQDRFVAEWDFSSASPGAEQPGLSIVASPDRGDGARMSWVRMTDGPGGLEVGFRDYQRAIDPECDGPGDPFVFTSVATGLDRATAHNIRIEMDFVDGITNDVVRVYVDDVLVHTGTSWEDYFRDCETNPTRTVDSLLFRSAGTAAGTAGSGFLIDNVATRSADQGTDTTASEFSTGFEPVLTSTTIQVSEADEVDWFAADTRAAGDLEFNTTYGGEIGGSAAILSTTSATADKVQLFTDLFHDTLLSDIDGLGYSTFRDSASTGFVAGLPALNLRVDRDNDDIVDTYLIYEPYQDLGNAAVTSDVWQTWDAIRGGAASWWASHLPGCGQATPCTWDTIVSTYPDARVLEDPDSPINSGSAPDPTNLQGSLGLNLGSFNPSITAAADALSVTVSGNRQIFDFVALFAPDAPTGLSATPGDGVVDLSWTAPADGDSPVTTYHVYRDGLEVGTTNGATTFQDTTANGAVPSSVPYSYTVSAENAVDEGPQSTAVNATVHLFWEDLEWELMNGTAVVNGADGVDLTRLGSGTAGIHLIGDPPVNAGDTPWVQWTYGDDGTSWPGIDMFIDSEVPVPNPRLQAGSLFTSDTLGYARYGPGGAGAIEEIVFPTVAPGPGPRSVTDHTIYAGQAASGRIDYEADGVRYSSDLLIGNGAPFVWKDVILRWRCDATASVTWERVCTGGETVTFDDFTFGDDHDFAAPEVTITSPVDGAVFEHNEAVTADYACVDEVGGSGVDTCEGPVPDGDLVDTSTLGAHDFTVTGTDLAGNESSVTHSYTVVDVTEPVITITTPVDGGTYVRGSAVAADFACVDEAGGSGVALCFGTVPDGVNIDTSTLGSHTFQVFALDNADNLVAASADYTVVDGTGPSVTITTPADGATFALDESVTADFACADEVGGSGLDTCVGDLADGAAIDTSTRGAYDFTVTATDLAGNETVVTHSYTVLDVTPPTVTITTPADGAIVEQDDVVLADFACDDEPGGSGLDSCVGDVADGAAIDTSTAGSHDFTVTGTDGDGNETVVTNSYSVCAGHPFSDVPPWVTDAVDWAWCNMYMTGLPGNRFGTDEPITRAQVARLLYRVAGSPDVSALPPHGLTDVPLWVEDAVTWMIANEYATGYDDDTFRPDIPISRGQVTRMQFRVEGSPAGSPPHGFSDVPEWVREAVNWIVDPANMPPFAVGYDDNTYRPNIDVSRGQVARMTCRINATPGTC